MSECISTGLKTSDAAILATGGVVLDKVTVVTDGTNDATLVVYDNGAAATGTVLAKVFVAGENNGATVTLDVLAFNGLYADVTGTGAAYIVYYRTNRE